MDIKQAQADNQSCQVGARECLDVASSAVTRAWIARKASVEQLERIAEADRALRDARAAAVVETMLDPMGEASWTDVGRALGISRQAARQAYAETVWRAMSHRNRCERCRHR